MSDFIVMGIDNYMILLTTYRRRWNQRKYNEATRGETNVKTLSRNWPGFLKNGLYQCYGKGHSQSQCEIRFHC